MQQNISSGLIFVVEGDRRKFVHDENFPIYSNSSCVKLFVGLIFAGIAAHDN